ncbi:MAG TPA: hypothetical protein VN962_09325 [Polyangia bacterium]|nr:hypothetical protein [Polyangia bacterium]
MRLVTRRFRMLDRDLRALALGVSVLAVGCSGAGGAQSTSPSSTPSGGTVCVGADGTVTGSSGGDVQLRLCTDWTCAQTAAQSGVSVTCKTSQPTTAPVPPGGYNCASQEGALYCPTGGGTGGGWICTATESQLTCTRGEDCNPGTEGCPSSGSGGSSGGDTCNPGTEGCPSGGSGGETGSGGRGSGKGGDTGQGGSNGGSGGAGGHCTFTQGYWKTHPDAWPVASLTIGGVVYSEADLLEIFAMDPSGDASLILAHQLIAALLNQADAANPPAAVTQALGTAQVWMAANKDADGRLPYGISPGSTAAAQATALSSTLDSFNNGLGGVPHCE